ncbi:hypothetical protein [Methylobacterium sp. Leaf118]|uniref:hypothetical protein n=1 Tax=Methylobacterium sp. Leaf118 TaxID=2876562 RepID=UPI001E538E27|nr:hypothetical protein [Methylobacterium sp. Leaf118]
MSLAEYQALDFSAEGALARDLAARLDAEADQPILSLSPPHGADAGGPALLTSAMSAWYLQNVSSARRSALGEVLSSFADEKTSSGNEGFLVEAERDRIEQAKQTALATERANFFQRKEISDLNVEIGRLHTEYERKRAEHGRDAQAWRPGMYFFGLFLFVMAEYPINLSAFLKIDFLTPAFATISVTLIAFGLAFSSHLIGQVVRQWSERFGENVTGRLKAESVRLFGVGLLLLLIGAAAIVFSRTYLVAEAVARSEALGEEGASTVSIYGLALIMNVFVYAIGLAWAIVFHDPVPNFMEERHRLEVLRSRLRKRYRTLLEPKQRQRIEEAQRAREQAERREADQAKSLRNHTRHRARFAEVLKADDRVKALLESHRSRLLATARQRGLHTRFVYHDLTSGDVDTRRELDGEAYLRLRLHLGYV